VGGPKCIVQLKYGPVDGVTVILIVENVVVEFTVNVLLTTVLFGVVHVIFRGMAAGP